LDFNYKPFRSYPDGHVAWVTTTEPNAEILPELPRPNFGGGVKVYNVIDSRQAYPQEIVARGVVALVPEIGAEASVHFGYEMVALSPAACEELGIQLSAEDRARPYIEMSGRKGLGVKADDLIDRLEKDALKEVETRHPELSADERRATAHEIAVGALRYFLLKFTRNSVIAFDFNEALSFEVRPGLIASMQPCGQIRSFANSMRQRAELQQNWFKGPRVIRKSRRKFPESWLEKQERKSGRC